MKTLLITIALATGGYFAYQYFNAPSPAYLAYQQFAEAMTKENFPGAKALATGPKKAEIDELLKPPPPEPAPKVAVDPNSIVGLWQASMEEAKRETHRLKDEFIRNIREIDYELESEAEGAQNRVLLTVVQTVRHGGTAASGGGLAYKFRHKVELVQEGESWKVYSFSETPLPH